MILDHLNVPGVILCGWDFLCNVGCTIDAKRKAVHFNSKTFKLAGPSELNNDAKGPKIWTANQFYTGMLQEVYPSTNAFHVGWPKNPERKVNTPTIRENGAVSSGETKDIMQEVMLEGMEQGVESKGVTRITATNRIQVKPFSRMLVDVSVHVKSKTERKTQGLFITNALLTEVECLRDFTHLKIARPKYS